jgi:hypothetical protein
MIQVLQLQAIEMQPQPRVGALEVGARHRQKPLLARLRRQGGERTNFDSGSLHAAAKASRQCSIVRGPLAGHPELPVERGGRTTAAADAGGFAATQSHQSDKAERQHDRGNTERESHD